MSLIMTTNTNTGKPTIYINVDGGRELIRSMNLKGWVIDIQGDPDTPIIDSVRFIDCKIVADNMRAIY